ncbi:potassium channel family protein [Mesoplasma corruscae]|uniref:Potassium uptake protein KtrA n=1 Tax=Mesoplasma corruscae TaxID=216874 RepID=A0A2S5RGP3_9MOLU|nr:TrkA family potassium uptake protein [Mesoplasma corruscae]PPE06506.1 potassium uptake protein KtrA [Mesoplasma corruscae]
MAKRKSIAIIGISNFSLSVIKTLVDKKQYITVFDYDEDKLNLHLSEFDYGVDTTILDATSKTALARNGIGAFDVVIIGISNNMESGLMTVLNLLDLGCENIIVKAKDSKHKRLLTALGLNENQIIIPDDISGNIVAARAVFNIAFDVEVNSVDQDYISTSLVLTNFDIFGKTIAEVGLSSTKEFNIIQLRRNNKILIPDDYTELKENDEIVVFAKINIINELANKIQGQAKDSKQDDDELEIFEELENISNTGQLTDNLKNAEDVETIFDSIIFDDTKQNKTTKK